MFDCNVASLLDANLYRNCSVQMKRKMVLALALAWSHLLIAADLASAQTFFEVPPTDISIHNPSSTEGQRNRTTLSVFVPADAGASLKALVLTQLVNIDHWDWGQSEPVVYKGRYSLRGRGVEGLATKVFLEDDLSLVITLSPAVEPGERVNIVMKGYNPTASIYQWTSQFVPDGPDPIVFTGKSLRLSIYEYDPFN